MPRIQRILLLAFLFAARTAFADHVATYTAGDTVHCDFTTATSVATALSSGAVTVYKAGGTSTSTSGVTLTASRDSLTGFNHLAVDTSADGTFYASGYFDAVLSGGTVGGASVVGFEICSWRIGTVPADAIKVGGTTQTAGDILGTWTPTKAGFLDVAVSSRAAAGTAVTVLSTVFTGGDFTIYQGTDNFAVDGLAIDFAYTGTASLSGATPTLTIYRAPSTTVIFTGTVSGTTVRFEPTATQTAAANLPSGDYGYLVKATLSGGHVIPLFTGRVVVKAQ